MEILTKLAANLNRRGFQAMVIDSRESIAEYILPLIKGKSVGIGNSMTIKNLGLIEIIKNEAKECYTHLPGKSGSSERNALLSDIYLTSANAISIDGQIVNIDGTGNRVAATCFGPRQVIYLIGQNKIASNLNDAIERAKQVAVKLASQYKRKTPCVKTNKCTDCLSPDCICSITTIHRKNPYGNKIIVLLINESLGL